MASLAAVAAVAVARAPSCAFVWVMTHVAVRVGLLCGSELSRLEHIVIEPIVSEPFVRINFLMIHSIEGLFLTSRSTFLEARETTRCFSATERVHRPISSDQHAGGSNPGRTGSADLPPSWRRSRMCATCAWRGRLPSVLDMTLLAICGAAGERA